MALCAREQSCVCVIVSSLLLCIIIIVKWTIFCSVSGLSHCTRSRSVSCLTDECVVYRRPGDHLMRISG